MRRALVLTLALIGGVAPAQLPEPEGDDPATTLALEVEPHRLVGAALVREEDAAAYLTRYLLSPRPKGARRACDPANAACIAAADALGKEAAPEFLRLQARVHAERLANGFKARMTEAEIEQVRAAIDTPAARKFVDALLAYRRGPQDAEAAVANEPLITAFHQQIYDYFINETAKLPKARK
ncbi:hypothetical protein [Sphingomonas jatrophae]|uniref:DUF4142 domain-containing protein n=1 Tax=Sphingomonas jatrophae TaxID=1166337 RepID=A0A1I6L2Z3_9SPHN|nr:hypothetical protein [Sphingomonas jatrophae]SFR97816.1 hypothetical protein SAMN05192580_2211 [Sphingomonas jatrophae]